MNRNPTPQSPHLNDDETAFLRDRLKAVDSYIIRLENRLNAEEDVDSPKTQALFRFHNAYLRLHIALKQHETKIQQKKVEPAPPLTTQQTPPKQTRVEQASPLAFQDMDAKTGAVPALANTNPVPQNILTFAQNTLEITLFPHQQQLCLSQKRITILVAGRGAGKSVAARVVALHHACSRPHHTVLVVSSGQRMSSDFGGKLLDLLRESPLRDLAVKIANEQVKFQNGSEIKLLPANPDTIRGYHPKSLKKKRGMTIILDEACYMERGDDIRKAVEYALITTPHDLGRLYIVTSPTSIHSWVHDYALLAEKPETGVEVIQCASSANPNITPAEIERLRATKNEHEFRAEVLGLWVDSAFSLFSGLIEPNIVALQDHPLSVSASPREKNECAPLPPQAVYALGADLALSFSQSHDRNALAVVAKWQLDPSDPDSEFRYRILEIAILDQASDHEIQSTVTRMKEQYDLQFAAIEHYQGKALAEHCQSQQIETELAAPTSGNQQMIFHEMHRLLRQRLLELPAALPSLFFEELRAFEYRREADGRITFGHPGGGKIHDDTIYAVAWALHAVNRTECNPPHHPTPPLIQFIPKI